MMEFGVFVRGLVLHVRDWLESKKRPSRTSQPLVYTAI